MLVKYNDRWPIYFLYKYSVGNSNFGIYFCVLRKRVSLQRMSALGSKKKRSKMFLLLGKVSEILIMTKTI